MARQTVRDTQPRARSGELPRSHWRQWHDVRPRGLDGTRIDHLLAGPTGVYVVARAAACQDRAPSRATAGSAAAPEPLEPPEPVVAMARACVEILRARVPRRYREQLRAVVCLAEDVPVADTVADALVTSASTLDHIVRSSPARLSTSEVRELSVFLERAVEPLPPAAPAARGTSRLRRWLYGAAAAAAATATGYALAPQLGELFRLW